MMVVEMIRHEMSSYLLIDKERADIRVFTRGGYNMKPQDLTPKGRKDDFNYFENDFKDEKVYNTLKFAEPNL